MFKAKNRIIWIVTFVLFTLILNGCNKAEDGEEIPDFKNVNALKVNDDLSITKTLVDSFLEDYYRTDELLKMLSEEANTFNLEYGAGSLVAEKVEEQDGLVNVVMKFSGREAYVSYNEAVFFVGTVEVALGNGLRLNQDLVNINDPDKTISNDNLSSMGDTYILITNEHHILSPMTIETFGRISYVTKGIEPWIGRNSVSITAIQDDLIYILFK